MKKYLSPLLTLLFLVTASISHAQGPFMFGQEPKLEINNRILANINGRPISVMDVMKKMDVIFYRQFPEYRENVQARAQFYQASWKDILQQLVDKELIVADAEEGQLVVSNGDVRQEMESMFGPNIIANLDRIGLSFEDAWNIVKDEITIRRMLYFRVNTKAIKKVTPQIIYNAYEEYAKSHPRQSEWRYHVISLGNDPKAAQDAYNLLVNEKVKLDELATVLSERNSSIKVNVSNEYNLTEQNISLTHKEVLCSLQNENFSEPVAQTSRKDNSTIYRIFYLKEMTPGGTIPFFDVETSLIDQLTDMYVSEETNTYIDRLRHHFGVPTTYIKNMTPEEFQPFVLR